MIDPQLKTIGGKDFQFYPLPVLKAARLDKRVLGLLVPLLGSLELNSLLDQAQSQVEGAPEGKLDLNMDSTTRALRQALESLPDHEFEAMLQEMLSFVAYVPSGAAPVELNSSKAIDQAFSGDLMCLYKVLFEVMRYNKFTPFAITATGGLLKRISGLPGAGNTTARSEGSSVK